MKLSLPDVAYACDSKTDPPLSERQTSAWLASYLRQLSRPGAALVIQTAYRRHKARTFFLRCEAVIACGNALHSLRYILQQMHTLISQTSWRSRMLLQIPALAGQVSPGQSTAPVCGLAGSNSSAAGAAEAQAAALPVCLAGLCTPAQGALHQGDVRTKWLSLLGPAMASAKMLYCLCCLYRVKGKTVCAAVWTLFMAGSHAEVSVRVCGAWNHKQHCCRWLKPSRSPCWRRTCPQGNCGACARRGKKLERRMWGAPNFVQDQSLHSIAALQLKAAPLDDIDEAESCSLPS